MVLKCCVLIFFLIQHLNFKIVGNSKNSWFSTLSLSILLTLCLNHSCLPVLTPCKYCSHPCSLSPFQFVLFLSLRMRHKCHSHALRWQRKEDTKNTNNHIKSKKLVKSLPNKLQNTNSHISCINRNHLPNAIDDFYDCKASRVVFAVRCFCCCSVCASLIL